MSNSLQEGGGVYNALHDTSNRLITSAVMTCIMLLVATGLSFFLPTALVLGILAAPGLLTFTFGGMLVRSHPMYNLSTNQRLAIERYREADKETQKMFPKGWEETVRKASNSGHKSDAYQLAAAADKIIKVAQERNQSLNLRDDRVEVALTVLKENTESLEREVKSNQEIYAPTPKRMIGRKVQDR